MVQRIIAKIDVKSNSLVKGINLEGLRALGDPSIFAKNYYADGADEIIYHDVVASLYDQSTIFDLISHTAKEIFIPLTVSGGIRSINDIKKILSLGADKIAINSQAIRDREFISKSAQVFGSSTIVISIETMKINKEYYVFYEYGRVNSGIKLIDWIEEVQLNGAGEILLTSISHEGTGLGFDKEMINLLENKISVPFIINGGCGSTNDIVELSGTNFIDGFVISSLFHYDLIERVQTIKESTEGNIEFLKNYASDNIFKKISINQLKKELKANNLLIR
jgi:cyclase